jgi:hypothetical protein
VGLAYACTALKNLALAEAMWDKLAEAMLD